MKRHFRWSLLWCACLLAAPPICTSPAHGDEPNATQEPAANEDSLLDRVKENPNDAKLLNEFFGTEFQAIFGKMQSDPDAAEKQLRALEGTLKEIEATEQAAKNLLQRAEQTIPFFDKQLTIARVTLEEARAQLKENPADEEALSTYQSKVSAVIGNLISAKPGEAEEQLTAAKNLLTELSESAVGDDAEAKQRIERVVQQLARLESRVAVAKRQMELIGQEAAPLKVEAWVNGEPLTEADLKGKVVLLDFWAIWCGPCIATFPHLREWQETYADKGLVIVGLTRYYGYHWDEEAGQPARPQEEKATPEQEQEMLVKFAQEHDLHHRFAIQEGNDLSEYYAVSGIPHVVVIDQEGKIRLIRVGSGTQNAEDISKLLAELLQS